MREKRERGAGERRKRSTESLIAECNSAIPGRRRRPALEVAVTGHLALRSAPLDAVDWLLLGVLGMFQLGLAVDEATEEMPRCYVARRPSSTSVMPVSRPSSATRPNAPL